VDNVYNLRWNEEFLYGDIHRQDEVECSKFNFELADVDMLKRHFDDFHSRSNALAKDALTLPAYEYCLKCSHVFNLLDARGAISVNERTGYIARVRGLARLCAESYINNAANAHQDTNP
jgi:glycyl-tRNA synthetase alpha chain